MEISVPKKMKMDLIAVLILQKWKKNSPFIFVLEAVCSSSKIISDCPYLVYADFSPPQKQRFYDASVRICQQRRRILVWKNKTSSIRRLNQVSRVIQDGVSVNVTLDAFSLTQRTEIVGTDLATTETDIPGNRVWMESFSSLNLLQKKKSTMLCSF